MAAIPGTGDTFFVAYWPCEGGAQPLRLGREPLRLGTDPDVVLFNPESVEDHATFENPFQPPTGVDGVWIGAARVLPGNP